MLITKRILKRMMAHQWQTVHCICWCLHKVPFLLLLKFFFLSSSSCLFSSSCSLSSSSLSSSGILLSCSCELLSHKWRLARGCSNRGCNVQRLLQKQQHRRLKQASPALGTIQGRWLALVAASCACHASYKWLHICLN